MRSSRRGSSSDGLLHGFLPLLLVATLAAGLLPTPVPAVAGMSDTDATSQDMAEHVSAPSNPTSASSPETDDTGDSVPDSATDSIATATVPEEPIGTPAAGQDGNSEKGSDAAEPAADPHKPLTATLVSSDSPDAPILTIAVSAEDERLGDDARLSVDPYDETDEIAKAIDDRLGAEFEQGMTYNKVLSWVMRMLSDVPPPQGQSYEVQLDSPLIAGLSPEERASLRLLRIDRSQGDDIAFTDQVHLIDLNKAYGEENNERDDACEFELGADVLSESSDGQAFLLVLPAAGEESTSEAAEHADSTITGEPYQGTQTQSSEYPSDSSPNTLDENANKGASGIGTETPSVPSKQLPVDPLALSAGDGQFEANKDTPVENSKELSQNGRTASTPLSPASDASSAISSQRSLSAMLNGHTVMVEGTIPDGAKLCLRPVDSLIADSILEQSGLYGTSNLFAVDMEIVDRDGCTWQPSENVQIKVGGIDSDKSSNIGVAHVLDVARAIDDKSNLKKAADPVLALALPRAVRAAKEATGEAGAVYIDTLTDNVNVENRTTSFDTDSLSVYVLFTVDFHYGTYNYSMRGMDSVLLSELLRELAIDADLTDSSASFTDSALIELIPIHDNMGISDWRIQSKSAFNSEEELTVVLRNGDILRIAVTDAFDTQAVAWHEGAGTWEKQLTNNAREFTYTGAIQSWTVPVTGNYRLETWGAQGGTGWDYAGFGGYSAGTVHLTAGQVLYIAVGGEGAGYYANQKQETTSSGIAGITVVARPGGWNGGGSVESPPATGWSGCSGGGATHIATSIIGDGQLKNYASNKSNVLIVAGGGGGAANGIGGYGGGATGGTGIFNATASWVSTGGTQSSGYAFGQGAPGNSRASNNELYSQSSGGGGGGYYGGNSNHGPATGDDVGGGGGSGYLSSVLTNTSLVSGSTCITEPDGSLSAYNPTGQSAVTSTGHHRSGYARIAYADSYVAYLPNSGKGTMESSPIEAGVVVLSSNIFVKAGYRFTGWNTQPDGSGTGYSNGATIRNLAHGLVLYAQWELIPYTVSYDANGGSGTMPSSTAMSGTATALPSCAFTPPVGYTFDSWLVPVFSNTSEFQGGGAIGAPIENEWTYGPDVTTCIDKYGIGQWHVDADAKSLNISNAHTVDFILHEGNGYKYEFYPTRRPNFDIYTDYTHYSFGTEIIDATDNIKPTVRLCLFGLYRTGNIPVVKNIQLSKVMQPGEALDGFDEGISEYQVKAQWNPNTYSIAYAGMTNASYGSSHPDSATYDTPFEISAPSREGYTFMGWEITGMDTTEHRYGSSTTTASTISSTTETIFENLRATDGTVLFQAQWEPNTYSIVYDGMTGAAHGTSHPTSATYDVPFTVSPPSRVGYAFTGWNITGMDATEHHYGSSTTTDNTISSTTETSFDNLRATGGAVTFIAQWQPTQYTVTFDANGGSVSESSRTVTYGSLMNDLPSPTRAGYEFKGWYEDIPANEYTNYGHDYLYTDQFSVHMSVYNDDWSQVPDTTGPYTYHIVSNIEGRGWDIEADARNVGGYIRFCANLPEGAHHAVSNVSIYSLSPGWHDIDVVVVNGVSQIYIDGTLSGSNTYTSFQYFNNAALFANAETGPSVSLPSDVNTSPLRIANFIVDPSATLYTQETAKNSHIMPASDLTLHARWEPLPAPTGVEDAHSPSYAWMLIGGVVLLAIVSVPHFVIPSRRRDGETE